jgi:catechol 2,3-dioxygenase-like lactoylglutathione lyase family enzyme
VVFSLRSKDPQALGRWYAQHLGFEVDEDDVTVFRWRYRDNPEKKGATVWAIFADDSDYFGSEDARLMMNYRVENLKAVLAELRKEGVPIEGDIRDNKHGRFAWIRDPEGHRIELWQSPEDY